MDPVMTTETGENIVRDFTDEKQEEDEEMVVDDEEDEMEPSVIDRRVREHRTFNSGAWSSDELRQLFLVIERHGCSSEIAVDAIAREMQGTRTRPEVESKLAELRQLIREGAEERRANQRQVMKGKELRAVNKSSSISTWRDAVVQIEKTRGIADLSRDLLTRCVSRWMAEETRASAIPLPLSDCESTSSSGRSICPDFHAIYRYLNAAINARKLPKLRAIEAAILVHVIEELESEADAIAEQQGERMQLIAMLFHNLQKGDLRDFLVDRQLGETDVDAFSLDPLNVNRLT